MSKAVSIVIGVEVVAEVDDETFDTLRALTPRGERASREAVSNIEAFSWLDELLTHVGKEGAQVWVKSIQPLTK